MGLAKDIAGTLVKFGDHLFAEFPDLIRLPYFNACLILWRSDCRLKRTERDGYTIANSTVAWAVPHPLRSSLYRRGLEKRLEDLCSSYSLKEIIRKDRPLTVVDCGANTGEIALLLPQGSTYFGFEPDEDAFKCLSKNISRLRISADLRKIALTNYSGLSDFFLSTRGADSSLTEPNVFAKKVSINVSTLDKILHGLALQSIDLLKVEAEGNEPEVIEGATQALKITNSVAVDAGPERGGLDTLSDVTRLLSLSGFKMKASVTKKGRFLFSKDPKVL